MEVPILLCVGQKVSLFLGDRIQRIPKYLQIVRAIDKQQPCLETVIFLMIVLVIVRVRTVRYQEEGLAVSTNNLPKASPSVDSKHLPSDELIFYQR